MDEKLKLKIGKSFSYLLTGESIVLLAAFIAGYSYALILGPNDYGVWQTAKVFISYSIVFTFSLPFVMRRDFVMLRSEGRHDEAKKIADLVFTYELFVTPLLSISLLLYAILFITNYLFKISVVTVAFIYLFQFIGGYSNILAKGLNNYQLLKNAGIFNGILTVLSIPVVYIWGIEGLLIFTVVIAICNSIYYYVKRPFNYNIFWDNKLFKSLLVISLPLYLQDISTTIFDSVDRLIIAGYLDFKEVGFYSLASLVIIPLRLFIASFSVVLFTQLNERYGYSKSEEVIEKHVVIPHSILSYVIPPFLGLAVMILPWVVSVFLPKYLPGVLSAQIALFATFLYLLNSFSANALFVLDKQRKTALIFIIVGILKTLLCYLSVIYGYGIVGVAISTVFVFGILDFLMLRTVFQSLNRSNGAFIIYFIREMLPGLWTALGCLIYFNFLMRYLQDVFNLNQFAVAITGGAFILFFCSPVIVIAYKRIKKLMQS
ncbi:oligosaccharide flippase family protein [Daejeonella sp.]|uniref:oligosaccharide flippase family protein n=1 Tax=Daejeonella sp. TaxID=2805397 RepID=UPI0030BC30C8